MIAAKAAGKKVYAADASEKWQDDNLGLGFIGLALTVPPRNALWASRVPKTGNGVVFGGQGHFTMEWNVNFQDFLPARGRTSLYHLKPPER